MMPTYKGELPTLASSDILQIGLQCLKSHSNANLEMEEWDISQTLQIWSLSACGYIARSPPDRYTCCNASLFWTQFQGLKDVFPCSLLLIILSQEFKISEYQIPNLQKLYQRCTLVEVDNKNCHS